MDAFEAGVMATGFFLILAAGLGMFLFVLWQMPLLGLLMALPILGGLVNVVIQRLRK